jgi:hypothetical protein
VQYKKFAAVAILAVAALGAVVGLGLVQTDAPAKPPPGKSQAPGVCSDPKAVLRYMAGLSETPFKIRIVNLQTDDPPKTVLRRVSLTLAEDRGKPTGQVNPAPVGIVRKLYTVQYEWPSIDVSAALPTSLPAGLKLQSRLETSWQYELARGQDEKLYVYQDGKPMYRCAIDEEEPQLEEALSWMFLDVATKVDGIVKSAKIELAKYRG